MYIASSSLCLNLQPKKLKNEMLNANAQNKLSIVIKLAKQYNFQPNEVLGEIGTSWNCIHQAIFFNQESILKYFLNILFNSSQLAYIDVINAKTEEGWTPLMISVISGSKECLILLLQSGGIRLSDKDNQGNTAYLLSKIYNQYKFQKLIADAFLSQDDTSCIPINLKYYGIIETFTNEVSNEEEKVIETDENNAGYETEEYHITDLINGNLQCISCFRSNGNFRYTLCCGKPMHQECYKDLIFYCPYCRSCSISLLSDARLALR